MKGRRNPPVYTWQNGVRLPPTGQNPIAPEYSLPQLGQVRWVSALLVLTAPSKATPRSLRVARNRPARPWQTVVPVHEQLRIAIC
jgi:hypothetical protein